MKKVTKFFLAALLAGMCSFGYAQDYLNAPKQYEKNIGTLSVDENGYDAYTNRKNHSKTVTFLGGTKLQWYNTLLDAAKLKYPNKSIDIRSLETGSLYLIDENGQEFFDGPATGIVVDLRDPKTQAYGNLSQALTKALRNVREGSRMAIDQITVTSSMDRENLKDQLIDVLLEKGYRVVAKEHLQKLYKEQEDQLKSGFYNPDTTVEGSNFLAVGYFINVKVTETSIRVQVVNVSTGEYEGNATVNF